MHADRFLRLPKRGTTCPISGLSRFALDRLAPTKFEVDGEVYVYWHEVRRKMQARVVLTAKRASYRYPRAFQSILASFDSFYAGERDRTRGRMRDSESLMPPGVRAHSGPYKSDELPMLERALSDLVTAKGADAVVLGFSRKAVTIYTRAQATA